MLDHYKDEKGILESSDISGVKMKISSQSTQSKYEKNYI